MTPTEKSIRAERIHDVWRKASRRAGSALAAYQASVGGDSPAIERRRLFNRAQHMLGRARKLALAEVRLVLGA